MSLRKRVAVAFALCVVALSVLWGLAFYAAIRLSEDRVLMHQLRHAAANYPALTSNLRGYDDVGNLPQPLREWARRGPDYGLHEFTHEELHVAVVPAANAERRAFVVFDVAGIEAASSEDWWLLLVITSVVGTLGALGFGLGVVVMRRAVAPVVHLAKVVADIDLEHLSAGDHQRIESGRFGDDELGVLAGTLEKTLERISAFIARERYFTGSASHELRTPITVIMGALELLEQSDLSADDATLVDRVRRATLEMKATIEMFLCLARETDDGLYAEQFSVLSVVTQAVDQQRHLLTDKSVEVDIAEVAEARVCGQLQAFSIAVNNLVRNAFEHTLAGQGPITIRISGHELRVTNFRSIDAAGPSMPSESSSQGYGLGLGIVQRLCERNGWSFSLRLQDACVTACLSWGHDPDVPPVDSSGRKS